MDLVEILTLLKGASPWLVLVGGILAALWMVLTHRAKSRERCTGDELRDILVAVHDECEGTQTMLAAHVAATDTTTANYREVINTQTSLLTRMVSELASINAATSGRELTMETAKIIIQFQWEACRDETIRLLLNSISNNHFLGNEKVVARKVFRAWRQTADKTASIVGAHPGMTYPYTPLFALHISRIWARAWEQALPIYHGDIVNKVDALEDLAASVKALFSEVLKAYYSVIEDIDKGSLYANAVGEATDMRTKSESVIPINDAQSEVVEDMLMKLRDYKAGQASGSHSISTVHAVVQEDYTRTPLNHTPPPPDRTQSEILRRRQLRDARQGKSSE